jgi:hypothetical protein
MREAPFREFKVLNEFKADGDRPLTLNLAAQ